MKKRPRETNFLTTNNHLGKPQIESMSRKNCRLTMMNCLNFDMFLFLIHLILFRQQKGLSIPQDGTQGSSDQKCQSH